MIAVYINYPRTRCSIHVNSSVEEKQRHDKKDQRILKINVFTISSYFEKFKKLEYRFEPSQEYNDMWLEVDFGDEAFEIAVAKYVLALIAERYPKMGNIPPEMH
ncbi:hypothetical protein JR338_11550 [Chloroflexota bacterium]|nr:hypothetical protein JR338_11550 [Chloroflexota bacterium]